MPFAQIDSSKVAFCKTVVKYHDQEVGINKICQSYLDFRNFARTSLYRIQTYYFTNICR